MKKQGGRQWDNAVIREPDRQVGFRLNRTFARIQIAAVE